MRRHTDDEPGLGSTVASLSLGYSAVMAFWVRERLPKDFVWSEEYGEKAGYDLLGTNPVLKIDLMHVSGLLGCFPLLSLLSVRDHVGRCPDHVRKRTVVV